MDTTDTREARLPSLLFGGGTIRIRATDSGLRADCDEVVIVAPGDHAQVMHVHALFGDSDGAPVIELRPGETLYLKALDDDTIGADAYDTYDAAALEIRFVPEHPCGCTGA